MEQFASLRCIKILHHNSICLYVFNAALEVITAVCFGIST